MTDETLSLFQWSGRHHSVAREKNETARHIVQFHFTVQYGADRNVPNFTDFSES